jgi:glycosyltransferase involved in cell wall biosynthesis
MSRKNILILLKSGIYNESRTINFINTLSIEFNIHLYCLNAIKTLPENYFNSNVSISYYETQVNVFNKFIKHTLYWLEYSSLFYKIRQEQRSKHFDLIIAHDLPMLYVGVMLSKHFNSKLIYDSLEIYNETVNQFFPNSSGVKKYIFRLLIWFMRLNGTIAEKYMCGKVHDMITVNHSLANYFEKKYELSNVKVVMNCPKKITQNITPFIDFRSHFGFKENDKIILYQGVLNEGRGLFLLIDSFKLVVQKRKDVRLIFLGSGVLKSQMIMKVNNHGITEHVVFHEPVEYKYLLNYTVAADFGINLLEDFNLSKKLASPNKLFEYMQASLPVLCSYSPENNLIFSKYSIGLQCKNNPEEILEKIIELVDTNHNKILKYKDNLKNGAEIYNWENQSEVLLETVKSILK